MDPDQALSELTPRLLRKNRELGVFEAIRPA